MATTSQTVPSLTGNRIATALVVSGLVSILTLGVAFTLLALGVEFFWVAFPVGFGGVLPIALGVVALATAGE
ncbi:hypothetical protein [Halobellus ruber]|uniref:Uncharacterized protein n=1 Tax=Halobellus ruber TaxID=2761102 RepID=A0A7J9SGX2_9EURY|nr:hypothetical protein [Halobellus ruber]MBB6645968.1 hypothetical protein [Halobellus ruber]